MENLVSVRAVAPCLDLRGRRVLVTGHTGFKGAWLCEWLLQSGVQVFGIALPPESDDALFNRLRLADRLKERHIVCDILDAASLADVVREAEPEFIFHLAAQALVRRSYREPVQTWSTNVVGTLNLLEAARALQHPTTVVVATTDKVYKNREWEFAYREDDELGGHDPYSASKAGCEIAVASWRASFGSESGVTVVTARAGNVLGPGDVSEDRIVPDCYRAWKAGDVVQLRSPGSTRPWQHVLEPLSGYLALAKHACRGSNAINACNFGPGIEGDRSVEMLVSALAEFGPERRWAVTGTTKEHEARALSLSIDRARHLLGWTPRLTFQETLGWVNDGYTASANDLHKVVERQIAEFVMRSP